jgi:hypothetical protein
LHLRVLDGAFEPFLPKFGVLDLAVFEGFLEEGPVLYLVVVVAKVLEAPASGAKTVQIPFL